MTGIDVRSIAYNPRTDPAVRKSLLIKLAQIELTETPPTPPKPKPPAHRTGQMNKTEAAYARELDRRIEAGEIAWYRFEPFKLRLGGQTCGYTIDFLVCTTAGRLECHEVKGPHIREDALIKWKWAADSYDWWRFVMVQRDGVRWVVVRDSGEPRAAGGKR